MHKLAPILLITFLSPFSSFGEKKIDLDDLKIKGELHDDNRLRILARDSLEIKNYVKFRTHFRKEIVEGLPKPKPKVSY